MKRTVYWVLTILNYFFAVFMMYAGIVTMFLPLDYEGGRFGWLYNTRLSLVLFGIIFFLSGFVLFYGKVRKKDRLIGLGLQAIYLCYLFAALLNWVALGWYAAWQNFIGAAIVGALYLRWKYKAFYVVPRRKRYAKDGTGPRYG